MNLKAHDAARLKRKTLSYLITRNVGQRQITGESTQFLPLADWAGMVETELFAQTNRSYVLQITKPKTVALHYGSVVHLVLQYWNMMRWRKQPFDITKLKQVISTAANHFGAFGAGSWLPPHPNPI